MSTLREELRKQRDEAAVNDVNPGGGQANTDEVTGNEGTAASGAGVEGTNETLEMLTLDMQIQAAQLRFDTAITYRYYSTLCNDYFYISTPYGEAKSHAVYGSYEMLSFSSCCSDDVGRTYLKRHGIKDTSAAIEISDYYYRQSLIASVEQNKDHIPPQEYNVCMENLQEFQKMVISDLNRRGFAVNPKTGELEYNNQVLQNALARTRTQSR